MKLTKKQRNAEYKRSLEALINSSHGMFGICWWLTYSPESYNEFLLFTPEPNWDFDGRYFLRTEASINDVSPLANETRKIILEFCILMTQ